MADGSEVARKISQIVLLDSDFGTLPDVVREGRRCINNVRQSASLFLMKTILTLCLTIYAIVTVSGYPFEPKQFTLLELFVIGISSVLLALEPNNKRIEGTFLKTVIIKSVPSAVVMFIPVLIIMIMGNFGIVSHECRNSVAMIVVTLVGLINMYSICLPFTKWRALVCGGVTAALLLVSVISIFFVGDLFMFAPSMENPLFLAGMVGLGAALAILLQILRPIMEKLANKIFELIEKKGEKKIS
jgi:cation-transporting ATPase E